MRTARHGLLGRWVLFVVLIVSLASAGPLNRASASPIAPQSATLAWTGPMTCPPAGCAGGQTVSLRFFYTPQGLLSTPSNLMVCLYAPAGWVDDATLSGAFVSPSGINTGQPYTPVSKSDACRPPAGMALIIQATASLDASTSSDAVEFAFRLAPRATGIHGVEAVMLVPSDNGESWTAQQTSFSSVLQAYDPGAVSLAYVANDAAACGYYQPCYVNSGVDLTAGIGTGLKDAVDILQPSATGGAATINLLGSYTIKSNTVQVNKALTLTALGSATLTYNDLRNCGKPMLSLEEAVTLSGLTVNDGGCSGPHRDLIRVASSQPVLIQSNTLTGGNDAILIDPATTGTVTVRFNQITGNAGKSVSYQGDGTQGGALYVTANNLTSVQCAASGSGAVSSRQANHNYWASGLPTVGTTRCTIDLNKRLGLPIAAAVNGGPGVNAVRATVTSGDASSAPSVMGGQVLFYHHADGPDFSIYVVDHGFLTSGGAPFSGGAAFNAPMPCSNYWDIFLDEAAPSSSGTLELLLSYGKGSTDQCVTTINSTRFCGQTTSPALYPLYWLDPSGGAGTGWITTGASGGQVTSCNAGRQLIQVSIDNDGLPKLNGNMGYTPLMVGVPVLSYFRASASNNQVTATWATNVEPNISGFYLLRGTDPNYLSPITGLIASRGSLTAGYTYPPVYDINRTNGVTYYYQLEIVRADGSVFFSSLQSTTGTSATATNTPTFTSTPLTPTSTPYPTYTPRPTPIYTRAPTLYVPPRTATPTLRTATPSPTFPLFDTLTETPGPGTPGAENTLTAAAISLVSGTPSVEPFSATPSPTATVNPEAGAGNAWLSLLYGLLAGLAATGAVAGAWYYLRLKEES